MELDRLRETKWREPWTAVLESARVPLERELRAELGPGHVLEGLAVTAIARRRDGDDVLFLVHEPPRLALVHLTFARRPEPTGDWPATELFSSLQEFLDRSQEGERAATSAEVRVAGPRDAERVRSLVAAFRDHLQASTPSDSQLEGSLPDLLADSSIEFACAWLDGAAVGYVQTRFFASLWTEGREALLEDLFVLPSARGRSIGRRLLRFALARARERGATLLGLTTNERNQVAQALYRSEGLRPQSAKRWENGREIRWVIELDAS